MLSQLLSCQRPTQASPVHQWLALLIALLDLPTNAASQPGWMYLVHGSHLHLPGMATPMTVPMTLLTASIIAGWRCGGDPAAC